MLDVFLFLQIALMFFAYFPFIQFVWSEIATAAPIHPKVLFANAFAIFKAVFAVISLPVPDMWLPIPSAISKAAIRHLCPQ